MLNLANIVDSEEVRILTHRIRYGDDESIHTCNILIEENFFSWPNVVVRVYNMAKTVK